MNQRTEDLITIDLDDVLVIEEGDEDPIVVAQAMQRAINSGMAWRLQGSYGRAAMDAISAGRNILGPQGVLDYWGNYVPSRDEVVADTIGSVAYAQRMQGEAWVEALLEVQS